ncbi:MAG: SPOR domain-containing protein [Desulfobulbaceae bacterium]|nr:SPOR domain-containing protein [Desulfobulbaceae bacterium]
MVRKAPEENALIRIELGCGGLLGLSVISFCIFLWMYLFGVWTGQSGLQSTLATGDPREIINTASKLLQSKKPAVDSNLTASQSPVVAEEGKIRSESDPTAAPPSTQQANPPPTKSAEKAKDENAASFFAIQVAAFRDEQKALRSVAQWRVREYDAFYLKPEPDGNFYRVLIGRFDSLAEANGLASQLESSEQNKVFISLVSENQSRYPAPQ